MISKRSNTASAKGRDALCVPVQKVKDMEEVSDNGRSVPDGLLPTVEPVPVSPLRAAIPSADALVQLMADWGNVPSTYFRERYPFFEGMLKQAMVDYDFAPNESTAATAHVFAELAEQLDAQAIEARRAETQGGSVADESAVAKPCAQGDAA